MQCLPAYSGGTNLGVFLCAMCVCEIWDFKVLVALQIPLAIDSGFGGLTLF